MSGSSSVCTLAAYISSSSLETRTFRPSVRSCLLRTQLGTDQKDEKRQGKKKKKSASFLPSSALKARGLSYAAGSCCLVSDCCPPLPPRSCYHPSESPRRPQSSPAGDSPLVLLAVGCNIRDAPDKYKNTTGAGMNKRSEFEDRR